MPLETATASSTPSQAAKSRSKRSAIGPSESCPERSTSSASSSSRSPISGLARGICSGLGEAATEPPAYSATSSSRGWNAYSSESTSASQEASMMFSETPIVPHSRSPSLDSSSTLVTAAVPWLSSRMRTL